jgi:hypothetical protein
MLSCALLFRVRICIQGVFFGLRLFQSAEAGPLQIFECAGESTARQVGTVLRSLDIVFENLDGQRGRTVLDECIGNLFQQSQVGTFLIDLYRYLTLRYRRIE